MELILSIIKISRQQRSPEKNQGLQINHKHNPIDGDIIDLALNSNIKDFEDSIQYFASVRGGIDIIVTRNKKDYPKGTTPIMAPAEFLKTIDTCHTDFK